MAKKDNLTISEYHLNKNQPDKAQFVIHDLNEYVRKNSCNTSKPHIHSYYQIIWFKSGSGKHFVDFKSYDVGEDSVFFIAKNQVHYFDDQTDYTGLLIHFNESFLVQNDSEVEFFLKCNFFNNPFQYPSCCINSNFHSILESYVKQMQTELASEQMLGRDELLRSYLKAFLIQVQRCTNAYRQRSDFPETAPDEKRVQLLKFVNLVAEHYYKGYAIAEYAGLMNISSRTLSELTAQALNKTPSQMVQERIVLEAKRLLLHSEHNINQIGYRLGFEDPSYFVKYFKKHTGMSPSDFRKSIS